MSTTHSSFDQYCISHRTIVTKPLRYPALKSVLPVPATNPGDATRKKVYKPQTYKAPKRVTIGTQVSSLD